MSDDRPLEPPTPVAVNSPSARHIGVAVRHGVRLGAAGLLAGVAAGAVAGLGARVAMLLVRLMNPAYNGIVTHAGYEVGQVTVGGTVALMAQGVVTGIPGALMYLVARPWIPGRGARKGLAFGLVLMVVTAPVVLDGNYEFFRYVPTWISVLLFVLLYPLYGIVVSPVTERLGAGTPGPPRNPAVAWAGYVLLAGAVVWFALQDFFLLRDVFQLYG
ncbi:MAG: hypothetical protein GEU74_15850 [Nitriliruptorales bacterium]|nr:hypothetical protein [Nitriliruptorales bacterium]